MFVNADEKSMKVCKGRRGLTGRVKQYRISLSNLVNVGVV